MQQAQGGLRDRAHRIQAVGAAEERRRGVVEPHLGIARHHAQRMYGGFDITTSTLPSSSGRAPARSRPAQARRCSAPDSTRLRCAQTNASGRARLRSPGRAAPRSPSRGRSPPIRSPRSTPSGCGLAVARSASIASCATPSVSGLGTNTPGPTASSEGAERCPSGDVLQRLASGAALDERCHGSQVVRAPTAASIAAFACTPPRLSPSTWPARSWASMSGRRHPARSSGGGGLRQELAESHSPARFARRASSSATMHDSMTGSSAPFITWSRL